MCTKIAFYFFLVKQKLSEDSEISWALSKFKVPSTVKNVYYWERENLTSLK